MHFDRLFNSIFIVSLFFVLPIKLDAQIEVETTDLQIISLEYREGVPSEDPSTPMRIAALPFKTVATLDFPLKENTWDHWIKITCRNLKSEHEAYVFDFENWAGVTLYDLSSADSSVVYVTGHLLPYRLRNVKNANHAQIEIEFTKGETKTLLVHLQSTINYLQVPSTLQFNVMSDEEFHKNESISILSFGIFTGFYLIMLIYNLFIYLSTKDKNYLPYLAALAASLLITIHIFGYFVPLFQGWDYYVEVHSEMQFYTSMLIGWSMLLFTAKFLQVRKRYPAFSKIIIVLMVLIVFLPIPSLLGYASINEKISGLLGLITMAVILTIAIKSTVDNYPSSGLFLIGYGAFAIGIGVMLSSFLGILPMTVQRFYPVNIGSFFEMAFFSLALGNRINKLIRDNQDKQKRIIEQLREKDELQANLTKELEVKVVERTLEIQFQKEKIENQKLTIESEKEKVEGLLLNILPGPVAQELQESGVATPKYFENVSVLFADFVSFTKKTAGLRPEYVINELNYCFMAFDDIVGKYNVEKIKTIGDGYLCASGVPVPLDNSTENIISAALEMQSFLATWSEEKRQRNEEPWKIRIGIHSGEVVAGVVGKRKFAYDIWGRTVNTAARIETACEPGMINISDTTYQLIKNKFKTSYRGKIHTREEEIDMYYVLGKNL